MDNKDIPRFEACITTDIDYNTDELNLDVIDEMCVKYNLRWRILGDIMQIFSWCDKWYFKIYPYNGVDPITLYHHNQGVYKTDDLRYYHKQNKELFTPYEIIEYIQQHDNYKYSKERIEKVNNTKINKIFNKIRGGK